MGRYVLRRLLQVVGLTFAFITITFIILQAMPGDITNMYISPEIPPEVRQALRERFGVDQPLLSQYARYITNFLRGDLGYSFRHYPRSVWDIIWERLPRTFVLFFTATVGYFYLGFTLGKIIAWKRGTAFEYTTTVGGVFLYSLFLPMYALLVIWFFAMRLGWFPVSQFITPRLWRGVEVTSNTIFGYIILSAAVFIAVMIIAMVFGNRVSRTRKARKYFHLGIGGVTLGIIIVWWVASGQAVLAMNIFHHMALPVLTLTTGAFAGSMLLMRDSMLETIKEDYVMAARAKGLPEREVRDRHAARTALLPMVTSFTLAIASVLNGGIITETIFSWPGMGQTLVKSVQTNDWPLALGTFAFTGIFVLFAHLAVDILYAVLDPRIRY